jgi:3-hydroxyisobutyryl-CoA hydrolase
MDYRISQRFMAKNDFFEGVRTVLIDKNDTPKWTYKSPLEVPESEVQSYFQPLTDISELQI